MDIVNRINELGFADWSFDSFVTTFERVSIKLSYNAERHYSSDVLLKCS